MNIDRRHFIAGVSATVALAISGVANAAQKIGSGTLRGRSGHTTKGGVTITKTSSGYRVDLARNFFLDGAPDPWLGFGKNGRFSRKTQFTKLRKNTGAQSYAVPASIKVENFNEFYVWCRKFSSPLGVAKIR